ncbi:MAG: site-specific DNA-methyltransferase [Bacteroidaceae bacterium]|nr:site-specific DNA-methyltransferase [Bacteroidaceae bacterium]
MAHKIERAVLAQRIRELDGLTNDERSALLELLNTEKRYGLVWENKPEDVEERLRESLPVLKEVKEKALTQGGADAPNHIIIEGDNLEALTALTYTHEGKIDVIYIDPPYNTGKEKEFKFNDNYIIKDGINWGFKHTYWLQFMAKRLKIAKRLLSNQGVLISHIDEHEFDAMNMLLREIFGENNSLGQIVWNKLNPKGETTSVAVMHEYLLVFAKNKEYLSTIPNALTRTKPNAKAILNKANSLFSQIGKTIVPADIKNVLRQYGFPISEAKDFKITVTLETVNREFQNWLKKSDFSNGEKAYKYIDPKGNVFTTVSMAAPDKPETRSHRPLIHPFTMQECPVPEKGWRLPDESMNIILGTEPASEILPGIVQQGEVVFSIGRNGIPSQPSAL